MPDYPQETLLRLLDLQEQDTAIKRLHEKRAGLPEAQQLSEQRTRLEELGSDHAIATKQHDEIAREQAKLEGEVELLEKQAATEEQRLVSGAVNNPKELSALQAKIEQLKRQRGTLEDELLEVMEQREAATETLDRLTADRDATEAKVTELGSAVALLTGEIEAELGSHELEREKIVPDIPEDLLKLYEKLREQKAGVGAAALKGGTCEGCHTKLPQAEWERIRHELGLQRCENCRRIVVVVAAQ